MRQKQGCEAHHDHTHPARMLPPFWGILQAYNVHLSEAELVRVPGENGPNRAPSQFGVTNTQNHHGP